MPLDNIYYKYMTIAYGIINNNIDVTDICFKRLRSGNYIIIPSGDENRAFFFSDPLVKVLKSIFITDNNGITSEYNANIKIYIDITKNIVYQNKLSDTMIEDATNDILSIIHNSLKIKHGSFNQELPEQKMAVRYLTGNEKILEIGGNIGRNSIVMASILKKHNNNNLVVLECDPVSYNKLKENRDINNLDFKIENSALSRRKLIQKGWDTIPSDTLLDGYTEVNTIGLDALKAKYNIEFDTLVLDCEGAFYYILQDMPEILKNVNLIIMENDYHDISHKRYVDTVLEANNFKTDYIEAGGWNPCYPAFFEVWKRII